MGLTCSVLGHRYGDREHIEERDRQGSEEVIAIREVKTCDRCGDELVVSESKEVVAVHDAEPPEPEAAPEPEEAPEPDPVDIAAAEASIPDEPIDPNDEADDGVILTEDEGREPGQWPPVEEETEPEEGEDIDWPDDGTAEAHQTEENEDDPTPWPDVDGEDEGFDVSSRREDPDGAAQVIEAAPDEPADDVEMTDAGFFRASSIESPAESAGEHVHTEYFCPRCDWSAKSLSASVRKGDICPDCRTGYISEREP